MAVKVQHLRSSVASKRPVASSLLEGEIALNIESTTSGGFYRDAAGTTLLKLGAAEVSGTTPNSTPGGAAGNARGELWLDTANAGGNSQDVLKIFNGVSFVAAGTTTIGTTNIELGSSSTALAGLTNVSTALLTLPGSTSGDIKIQAAAASDNTTYTWPAADGTDTHVLATNGSGVLTWQEARTNDITNGGSSISIDGSGEISIDLVGGASWTIDATTGDLIPNDGQNIGTNLLPVGNIYANNITGGTFTGTWNGDIIASTYGGTGIDNSGATDGQILIASAGAPATFTAASLGGGQSITITEGAGSLSVAADFAAAAAASDVANAGVASFDTAAFAVDANGFVTLAGTGALQTLTGDTGGALNPTAGNINIVGGQSMAVAGSGSTLTLNADVATAGAGSGTIGVASFESTDFVVTAGHVTLSATAVASTYTADDANTAAPVGGNLNLAGGTGISSTAAADTVTFTLDNTAVTIGTYGAAASTAGGTAGTVGQFTVDQQGRLTFAADVDIDIVAAQVSDFDTQVLSHTLDEFTMPAAGDIDMGGFKITNLGAPTADGDAANKLYVDQVAQGLDIKQSVTVATTGVLNAIYAEPGGAGVGVGATLTNNGTQAAIAIDGETLSVGDRVLVKDQGAVTAANALQNGIYSVTTVGSGSTNWVLTRAEDMDQDVEVPGAFAFVESGTANASNGYVCVTEPPVTFGTTEILFEQFSGAGQILAGDGLSKTGNTLDVNVDSRASGTKTTAIVNDEVRVDSAWEGHTALTTLGTITTGTWNGDIVGLSYGGTGVDNTSIAEGMVYMGPNYTGSAPNGSATFKELLTTDIAPITGGSFDAGQY
jgi:hypothetical protein